MSDTAVDVPSPPPPPGAYDTPVKFRDRVWLHALLFGLTLFTTTLVGLGHYASFLSEFGAKNVSAGWASLGYGGWYSLTILAILGAHEMGHYVACRYYRVDASLPYFIPMLGVLTGTFGAVIRIREPILHKRALFDIGIAGPIAGFVVTVPALFIGLWLSNLAPLPRTFSGLELGEPLLFKAAAWLVWGTPKDGLTINMHPMVFAAWMIWGTVPDGSTINMHPMAFAAWFGLLATALNLFPIAQLDGGHLSYAVLGPRSTIVTLVMVGVAIFLATFSSSWIAWTVLLIVMIAMLGPRHPPTLYDDEPLGRGRILLAAVAMIILALCFTPAPIGEFLSPSS